MKRYIPPFLLTLIALASPAHAGDRWTKDDIAIYCHSRFGTDDRTNSYNACIKRKTTRALDHDKSPAEQQEIDAYKAANPTPDAKP